MLTVIRELAEEAEDPRHATLGNTDFFKALLARGEDALARTPEQLAVLKEAGVVDAGGAGLLEIVRGVAAELAGETLPDAPVEDAHEAGLDAIHLELSEYRYCTVFVVEGDGLDAEALEAELEQLGDSLLVVGDPSALKVHVHTDDPGAALAAGTRLGTIEGIEIANMHKQTAERSERLLDTVPDPGSDARDGHRRRRPGHRQPAPLRGVRRGARDRGRADDEPVHLRHPRGDRGDAGDRGPRAAEQRQRDPLGRAGRPAGDEARARDPVALGARGAGGDRPLPPLAAGRRERGGDARGARPGRDRRGDDRLARRRARRRARPQGRLSRPGRRARRSPRPRASTRWPRPSSSACSRTARRC